MHGGFLLLVFASICIAHLHAAVFNVDVKHPSAAQKHQAAKWHQHLHRDHLARSQLAKQGNSKEMRKYLAMVSAKKLGEEHENLNDGESAEIEDLEVDENSNRHWMNPSGTIKLGIPPQDFIVAFSVASPDTFVASSGSVDWANFLTFNENKSYTFTDVNSTFQDSLFLNSNKRSCEPRNTGRVGKDLITLGNLVLPLKFGLVDNVNKTKCMDWQDSGVEGMFGLSLAKSANDMPSTLEQVAPILDEPAFSVLTISDEDKNEAEYHLKIGSTNIEGHCAAKDYTFFPSTSANVADENKDGFHTQLWRIELKYPNGSFARWNLPPKTEMEFTKLVTEDLVWNSPYIYGDAQTVEEVAIQLGGAEDFLGYMAVPCNIHGQPEMIFTFGDAHNKVEWVVHPEEYTMTNPWLPFECVSLLQYSRYYGSWTSLEYHNQLCFAVKFGPEGNQIGLARPLESN